MPNALDYWLWRANYTDDCTEYLDEEEVDGTPHVWDDIDQSRLTSLMLIPRIEGLPMHAVEITGTMRPIFFRRTSLDFDADTANQVGEPRRLHYLGWQDTVNGTNVKCVMCCYPNGSVLLTSDPDAINP